MATSTEILEKIVSLSKHTPSFIQRHHQEEWKEIVEFTSFLIETPCKANSNRNTKRNLCA